jgi:hypothetical protein
MNLKRPVHFVLPCFIDKEVIYAEALASDKFEVVM